MASGEQIQKGGKELFPYGNRSSPPQIFARCSWLNALVAHEGAKVRRAAGITPLVVVPAHYLHHVVLHDDGGEGVENTAVGVATHVGTDNGVFGVLQNAFQRPFGGRLEGLVYLVYRHSTTQVNHEVGYRSGGRGNPEGDAVQLSVQFRQHQAHRPAPLRCWWE